MTFPADAIADVRAFVANLTALSNQEAGCVEYWWAQTLEDPNTLRLFEVWESQDALTAHMNSPHGKEYTATIQPQVTGMKIHFYDPQTVRAQ